MFDHLHHAMFVRLHKEVEKWGKAVTKPKMVEIEWNLTSKQLLITLDGV